MSSIKYLLWFIIFVTLHYVEGLPPIAGLSVAQLWKMPLIAFLLLNAIQSRYHTFKFEKKGYYYSLTPFLNIEVLSSPFSVLLFSIKQLPTILFFKFWQKFNVRILEKILITLAQFICLTSLLTMTNIIQPIKSYQSAESIIEGMSYYSSIFGAAHAASSYFYASNIIIIFFIINKKITGTAKRFFNIALLCIGIYSLYLSFVRTGWIMFIISLLIIFIDVFKENNRKNIIKYFFTLTLVASALILLYNNNEAFRLRVSGGGQYKGESETAIDIEGSGRKDFWKNGIMLWANSDAYRLLFGNGTDAVVENNKKITGMPVGSHSLFVDTLAKYGLVAFVLLLLFYYYQYHFISVFGRGSPYQSLCISMLVGSILFAIFQGEVYFDFSAMYSIILVIMYRTRVNEEKKQK